MNEKQINQAKKQAKRLLSLADKNNGNLQINKLSVAQELIANLWGLNNWHQFVSISSNKNSTLESPENKQTNQNLSIQELTDLYVKNTYKDWAVEFNPFHVFNYFDNNKTPFYLFPLGGSALQSSYVNLIIGRPGDGKSTLAYHALNKFSFLQRFGPKSIKYVYFSESGSYSLEKPLKQKFNDKVYVFRPSIKKRFLTANPFATALGGRTQHINKLEKLSLLCFNLCFTESELEKAAFDLQLSTLEVRKIFTNFLNLYLKIVYKFNSSNGKKIYLSEKNLNQDSVLKKFNIQFKNTPYWDIVDYLVLNNLEKEAQFFQYFAEVYFKDVIELLDNKEIQHELLKFNLDFKIFEIISRQFEKIKKIYPELLNQEYIPYDDYSVYLIDFKNIEYHYNQKSLSQNQVLWARCCLEDVLINQIFHQFQFDEDQEFFPTKLSTEEPEIINKYLTILKKDGFKNLECFKFIVYDDMDNYTNNTVEEFLIQDCLYSQINSISTTLISRTTTINPKFFELASNLILFKIHNTDKTNLPQSYQNLSQNTRLGNWSRHELKSVFFIKSKFRDGEYEGLFSLNLTEDERLIYDSK